MKNLFISFISIIFLCSCERVNSLTSNITDEARAFDVGVCFIDYGLIELAPGEIRTASEKEVVNCSEAHNVEVISSYSYVPSVYLDEINPIDSVCYDDLIDYVDRLHRHKSPPDINRVYEEFDIDFTYVFFFTESSLGQKKADLNEEFQCSIFFKNGFKRGKFEKIIRNFGK
tara:strand:+ start:1681 stop:2196 length:516 start_codon:yes stop_codon:yes gene_type:complete